MYFLDDIIVLLHKTSNKICKCIEFEPVHYSIESLPDLHLLNSVHDYSYGFI